MDGFLTIPRAWGKVLSRAWGKVWGKVLSRAWGKVLSRAWGKVLSFGRSQHDQKKNKQLNR